MNYFGKVGIHMAMSSNQLNICDLIMGKKPELEIRNETHQNTDNSSSHEDNSHLWYREHRASQDSPEC